jgi:hypothetical protein
VGGRQWIVAAIRCSEAHIAKGPGDAPPVV